MGPSTDVCYYVSPAPGSSVRALLPATYPDNYVEVPGIYDLLAAMGIADKVQTIVGWHPDPSGSGNKYPETYAHTGTDTLSSLAGGYGYWVQVSEACTWKISGRARLKGQALARSVPLTKGWNSMGDLFGDVHYEGGSPAAALATDETGRTEETNFSDYLTNLVKVGGVTTPGAVEALIGYDEVFPHVRTYYHNVPAFLQTLKYAGPGLGILVKIGDSQSGDASIEYPAE